MEENLNLESFYACNTPSVLKASPGEPRILSFHDKKHVHNGRESEREREMTVKTITGDIPRGYRFQVSTIYSSISR